MSGRGRASKEARGAGGCRAGCHHPKHGAEAGNIPEHTGDRGQVRCPRYSLFVYSSNCSFYRDFQRVQLPAGLPPECPTEPPVHARFSLRRKCYLVHSLTPLSRVPGRMGWPSATRLNTRSGSPRISSLPSTTTSPNLPWLPVLRSSKPSPNHSHKIRSSKFSFLLQRRACFQWSEWELQSDSA